MIGRTDEWEDSTLGEAIEVLIDHRGKTPGKLGGDFVDSGVPAISAMHIKDGRIDFSRRERFVTHEMFERWMPERLKRGDVLMTSEAPLGSLALVPTDAPLVLSQRLFALRGREGFLDNRYLRWFLESPLARRQLEERSSGSTVTGIRQAELRQLRLPVPPIDQQRRVIGILEDHLSRIDAASVGLSNAVRRLVALERSALDAHFGWDQSVALAELIEDISAGKSFGASNAPARIDEWGIVKVSAMTWGDFNPDENKAVPADRIDPRFEIREGDLLVSRANTSDYVGASVLVGPVRSKLLLSDKSLRVTPNSRVRPDWLWRALQAPSARRQISALATGTKDSMRNISQSSLRRILLPKAGIADQARALAAFADVKESSDRVRREVEAQQARIIGLRRSLLAAALSGRLSDNVPDLSSAREMIGS